MATLGAFTLIIHFNVAKITQTMKDNVMSMASNLLFIYINKLVLFDNIPNNVIQIIGRIFLVQLEVFYFLYNFALEDTLHVKFLILGNVWVVPHLVKPYEESYLLLHISYLILFFSSNVTFQTYFENIDDRFDKI